jgi:Holliday junction DNA helicase RuvA
VISSVSGEVISLGAHTAVVEVAGIGYEIHITPRHSLKLKVGEHGSIFTRLIVREDDMALFGFQSPLEREQFDLLCSVSGIGPKLALTVVAGMEPDQLVTAVANSDEASFRAISGIGPKTAKLIIISLGGKLSAESDPVRNRVLDALVQLGTDESKARAALSGIEAKDESELLKKALAVLSSGKLG